jgi:hypothetical protein
MDTISDYGLSKANMNLLKVFSLKKVLNEKPNTDRDILLMAFDLYAPDIMESELEKVCTWMPTTENIAELNIRVWTALREKILSFLDARSIDPEKKINELFDSTMSRSKLYEEEESVANERESIFMQLKQLKKD